MKKILHAAIIGPISAAILTAGSALAHGFATEKLLPIHISDTTYQPIQANEIDTAPQVQSQLVAATDACHNKLGTSRIVTIDTTNGPHYGTINKYPKADFLQKKEVVLTFDDGPNPRATGAILDILKKHCVKATFFVVGHMAKHYPKLLKRMAAEGHTIAGHTHSHPMPFHRLSQARAIREIEKGFEQTNKALGQPIAPFFRFPGLQARQSFLTYLKKRHISALSVDVIGGDTRRGASSRSIIRNVMRGVRLKKGGIVLMHDPLKRTARALPEILRQLHQEGFHVVHMRTKTSYQPVGSAEIGRNKPQKNSDDI